MSQLRKLRRTIAVANGGVLPPKQPKGPRQPMSVMDRITAQKKRVDEMKAEQSNLKLAKED